MAWIKAYKGFNDKLQCTPRNNVFQYEVGKEYATDAAELCESGFHACEFPLDVFRYYAPSDSRYCEVELDATDEQRHDGSKRTGKKIKIGAEIGLDGIIKAGVKLILEKAESCDKGTDNQSAATNTGDWSAATNTGDRSTAAVSGKSSVAISTGRESKAKGALGCGIVLCEYDGDGLLSHIAARIVDGVEILPDTYYTLRGGKLVQAEEDAP